MSLGLLNGGFGGLFWVFVGTVLCYGTVVASLAEMESMAPTSGGKILASSNAKKPFLITARAISLGF